MRLTVSRQVTPRGVPFEMLVRPDTNEGAIATAVLGDDEYGLRDLALSGWALDVGGYSGAVGIALALDNPDLRVVIVEPVPANAEVIETNIAAQHLSERVTLVASAAAGCDCDQVIFYDYRKAGNEPANYVSDVRMMANIYEPRKDVEATRAVVPGISLPTLLSWFHIEDVALLKIDCEGCEWGFLNSPAVARIARLTGEYHGAPGVPGLHERLDATHEVEIVTDSAVGLFRAVRR